MEDKKNISVYIVEDYLLTRVTYKKALKDYENINIIGDFETAEECIKALEKQVPKKPTWKRGWHCDEMTTYSEWHCPHCNDFFRVDEMHLFCPSCGQAIDWRGI